MKLDSTEIRALESMELIAKYLVEGFIIGKHKSPYHGFSAEFAEHRIFNEGDSTRHVDWRVYARTDKMFIKKFEEEMNLRCLLVVDNSSSMHYPQGASKIRFSLSAAAALAYLLCQQRDAVGLAFITDQIDTLTPIKSSSAHLAKLFALLELQLQEPKPLQRTQLTKALHQLAEKIHTRSLVVIFTDTFDPAGQDFLFKALQHLKHAKHEVLLFQVNDLATEREFTFQRRLHQFIDLETQERIMLNPSDIKNQVEERLRGWRHSIQERCRQLKIDWIEVDCRGGVSDILQAYIIKRAKMH